MFQDGDAQLNITFNESDLTNCLSLPRNNYNELQLLTV